LENKEVKNFDVTSNLKLTNSERWFALSYKPSSENKKLMKVKVINLTED